MAPFVDWFRYTYNQNHEGGKRFLIPFLSDPNSIENVDVSPLLDHRICTSALLDIFKMGHTRWKSVRIAATSSNKICRNGNIGRKRSLPVLPEDDPRVIALHEHFKELMSLGEVRATRFVRNVVADGSTELVTRDDDNENVYLPATDGICPCYCRYGTHKGGVLSRMPREP